MSGPSAESGGELRPGLPPDGIVAFIRDRLGEWQVTAQAALTAERWEDGFESFDEDSDGNLRGDGQPSVNEGDHLAPRPVVIFAEGRSRPPYGSMVTEHIARHDPGRVLAEVKALSRIVDLHDNHDPSRTTINGEPACEGCHANWVEEWAHSVEGCPTKRLLASIWRDHPSYDPAWAPEEART